MAIAMSALSQSSEYRTFTNQDGQSVVARIVGYDADGLKVQLELENRKKAWVAVSSLSEEDRNYIRNIRETILKKSAALQEAAILSKEEVRAIAERYIEAWEEGDYRAWHDLVSPLHEQVHNERSFKTICDRGVSFKLGRIDGLNAQIDVKHRGGMTREGWLQLLPGGEIKYTPYLFPHPLIGAFRSASTLTLNNSDERSLRLRQSAVKSLENKNIPLFGYEADAPARERKKCVKEIFIWLIEEGVEWDATEPRIPLPEEQFEALVKQYEKYR